MFFILSAIAQLFLFGSMTLMAVCVVFIVLIYRFHRNQARLIVEKKQLEFDVHEQILKAQLEIQEETLKNISMEIHDNIGQTLSLAKLNLNRIETGLDQKLVDARELVGKAIQDLRSLSRILHKDSLLGMGLIEAIRFQLEQIERSGAFATTLSVNGSPQKLDPQKELILFRVVQESINNAIRHSQGNKIMIEINYQNDLVQLVIADNGNGFLYQDYVGGNRSGSGLRNMQNRIMLINGSFTVNTNSEGTIIKLIIPLR